MLLMLLATLAMATPEIEAHLASVETDLRAADVSHLDAEQRVGSEPKLGERCY